MANKRKGFNWKARQSVTTIIDNTKTKKIQLDLINDQTKYDESNALVLPSKKRETKVKKPKTNNVKLLSKTQRKKLEKVLERKMKKEKRAGLIESLAHVQISAEDMKKLVSIKAVQTRGLRHKDMVLEEYQTRTDDSIVDGGNVSSVRGLKRNRKGEKKLAKKAKLDDEEEQEKVENETARNETNDDGNDSSESDDLEIELEKPTSIKITNNVEISTKNIEKPAQTKLKPPKSTLKVPEQISTTPEPIPTKKTIFIPVDRKPEIQEARLKLPILADEQVIMEAINENPVVIVAGETGCGKTTQLPQFLYEAGYAEAGKIIGITEPRRVAAISMSQRVALEMNLGRDVVSYLIRFEGNVTERTKIKFMTDGVLLKELKTDFLLSKYSVIILDEAHERSLYTDILLGFLSRIVRLRARRNEPLKLIIMSATLRVEDFTKNERLFKENVPVLNVDARQFPVTVHFNRKTADDYVREAFRKVCKIHSQLPDGGILVFLTGQREVRHLVRKLMAKFPCGKMNVNESGGVKKKEKPGKLAGKNKPKKNLPEINLDDFTLNKDEMDANENDFSDGSDAESTCDDSDDETYTKNPLWVLPLYSMLSTQKQSRVFEPGPEHTRLCVVATNVAETSLTIPGVKYVVDCGRSKVRLYDKTTGVSAYRVTWVSKASANQRAGRAGRIAPGHCYRLYSSAVFTNEFEDFSVPEIQQKPVDYLYLQLKCMNIEKVMNFPFPTAPDLMQIRAAERHLLNIGALEVRRMPANKLKMEENDEKLVVSELGKVISTFPVLPRYGKMLALSHQHDLLPYVICIIAALSVQEVLLETPIGQETTNTNDDDKQKENLSKWIHMRRKWSGTGDSLLLGDVMVLLKAVGAAEFAAIQNQLERFCNDHGLRHKALVEIRKLRVQLTNEVSLSVEQTADAIVVDPKMPPPSQLQAKLLRQIVLCGTCDRVAHKVNVDHIKDGLEKAKWKNAYECMDVEEPVFINPKSVLRKEAPEWVVYQEVYEMNFPNQLGPDGVPRSKLYMRGVTAIEPEWLPQYGWGLCRVVEVLQEPSPRYDAESDRIICKIKCTYGPRGWPLPECEVPYPDGDVDKYKWFCVFFLEGLVCPKLKDYTKHLLSSPTIMMKTWAKLQPRTVHLLNAVLQKRISSRAQLMEVWIKEPKCLLAPYCAWLPESAHTEVVNLWPPV